MNAEINEQRIEWMKKLGNEEWMNDELNELMNESMQKLMNERICKHILNHSTN